jgi:hypothetical protein
LPADILLVAAQFRIDIDSAKLAASGEVTEINKEGVLSSYRQQFGFCRAAAAPQSLW